MVWRSLEQVNIVFLVALSKHEHVPMAEWSFSSCRKAVQHLDHQAQQHPAFSCNEMLDVLKSQTKLSALQNLNCYLATCFSEHLFHHVPNAFMAWQGGGHLSLSKSSRNIYCRLCRLCRQAGDCSDCRLSDFVGGIMVESFRILQICKREVRDVGRLTLWKCRV